MRLAADANVLLSAVLGGRAKLVLDHPRVEEIVTTTFTLGEVEEYAAELARRKKLPLDVVLLAVATLPLTVIDASEYEDSLNEAKRRIGRRDPTMWTSWHSQFTFESQFGRMTMTSQTLVLLGTQPQVCWPS